MGRLAFNLCIGWLVLLLTLGIEKMIKCGKNAEKLVINYGGKLTKSLSKNTSLVVVGNDAGPTKLEKIEELGIETLDEDAFIKMIEAGGGGTKRAAVADDDDKLTKTKKTKK